MTARPLSVAFVVLLSFLHALAQQNQAAISCPATEQAVREVSHQIWTAHRNRDVAAYDKLVDDSFISIDDGGVRKRKPDVLAELRKPEGNIHTDTDEQPEDVQVVFAGGVAIVNQTKHWTDYDKKSGTSWGAASRTTRVLTCTNGEWKLVAFHETDIPNKDRKSSANDHLDDYVGHYRFGENGDKGELSIVRKDDRLLRLGQVGKPPNFFPASTTPSSAERMGGWRGSFAIDRVR